MTPHPQPGGVLIDFRDAYAKPLPAGPIDLDLTPAERERAGRDGPGATAVRRSGAQLAGGEMTGPVPFAEVIGRLQTVAERFDRGEATRQELQDALMQLEGARRVVGEALVQAVEE